VANRDRTYFFAAPAMLNVVNRVETFFRARVDAKSLRLMAGWRDHQ
jgi:hypothetical protein